MKCSTVQISGSCIDELSEDGIATTVPREDIRRVKLSYNPQSRHPFLRFLVGFGMVVSGLIMIIADFIIVEVGVFQLRVASHAFRIPAAPIGLWLAVGAGLWLLIGVFRGRYNLSIDTGSGIRKVFFAESANIREILQFIGRANREFGYDIDTSIMETMYLKDAAGGQANK